MTGQGDETARQPLLARKHGPGVGHHARLVCGRKKEKKNNERVGGRTGRAWTPVAKGAAFTWPTRRQAFLTLSSTRPGCVSAAFRLTADELSALGSMPRLGLRHTPPPTTCPPSCTLFLTETPADTVARSSTPPPVGSTPAFVPGLWIPLLVATPMPCVHRGAAECAEGHVSKSSTRRIFLSRSFWTAWGEVRKKTPRENPD